MRDLGTIYTYIGRVISVCIFFCVLSIIFIFHSHRSCRYTGLTWGTKRKNVGQSSYTHAPIHPAVNGYRMLTRVCDLHSRLVTWHLPRREVKGC